MNEESKIYLDNWHTYYQDVHRLLAGELTDWERKFLLSIQRQYGRITPKQIFHLKKIIGKYLGENCDFNPRCESRG